MRKLKCISQKLTGCQLLFRRDHEHAPQHYLIAFIPEACQYSTSNNNVNVASLELTIFPKAAFQICSRNLIGCIVRHPNDLSQTSQPPACNLSCQRQVHEANIVAARHTPARNVHHLHQSPSTAAQLRSKHSHSSMQCEPPPNICFPESICPCGFQAQR